jgi:RimJ/RimL family protein N-acetyltransferase
MALNTQPVLETDELLLSPLLQEDLEALYQVASDPAIWEQHPNKNRWKREDFTIFFEGAMASKGAFKIIDKRTGNIIGSSRFYDYNEKENSIFIGYTFYATACWGKGINRAVKILMLQYAFKTVQQVLFHVGAQNIRSQVAMSRIGAIKTGEETVAYFGEPVRHNFVYRISKNDWPAFNL